MSHLAQFCPVISCLDTNANQINRFKLLIRIMD